MRQVFFISDGTAITSETLGQAVLSQFDFEFEQITIPFVETLERAIEVKAEIDKYYVDKESRPLIFHSIVSAELRSTIESCKGRCFDLLSTFVTPLESELNHKAKMGAQRSHGLEDSAYSRRIEAVNFALASDDGVACHHYGDADIILVGVSRSGKTPTCLYLAMQFGIKAANYPFIDQDMEELKLPKALKDNKSKLFGLTISPSRLHDIRSERKAGSRYASLSQCKMEIGMVERLFKKEKIGYLNTTKHSIEEISAKILQEKSMARHPSS